MTNITFHKEYYMEETIRKMIKIRKELTLNNQAI